MKSLASSSFIWVKNLAVVRLTIVLPTLFFNLFTYSPKSLSINFLLYFDFLKQSNGRRYSVSKRFFCLLNNKVVTFKAYQLRKSKTLLFTFCLRAISNHFPLSRLALQQNWLFWVL